MTFLDKAEKKKISQAIRDVETKTTGELVAVVARASDQYLYIPLLWAALSALVVPGFFVLTAFNGDYAWVYGTQVIVFLVLALVFRLPFIKMWLIPEAVKKQRAARQAREQFITHNLHYTKDRTGVLIFVSVGEHYVEIIADKGINDVVPKGAWDQAIAGFVSQVKAGSVADGYLAMINACGNLLTEHFPGNPEDKNELPNHLIEL